MPNLIRIKAFGMIAEKIGADSFEMENPESSEVLKKKLLEKFPELEVMKFSVAVDRKIIQSDVLLSVGAEVALLPPFSGG
jgi:molybdopterin converting factor small subunit